MARDFARYPKQKSLFYGTNTRNETAPQEEKCMGARNAPSKERYSYRSPEGQFQKGFRSSSVLVYLPYFFEKENIRLCVCT